MTEQPTAPGAAKDHPYRWRLHRAGIVNVWHYYAETFDFSGGRMILRGTNGSGKSRALEMLLPFLLDADRRRMDSTGSGKVRLDELMKVGAEGQGNRLGYLWLELLRHVDGAGPEHLTLGALVRWSASSGDARVWYFTTPLRVGRELELLDADRQPMSRERLTELVGADRVTDNPEAHRERVRSVVFGLTGPGAGERYDGLLQLIRTLRSPDVGNRIEEGHLPRILADALPPLSEATLDDAGGRLDDLSESRESQRRLATALEHVTTFLDTYGRYAAATLGGAAAQTQAAAREAERAAAAARDGAARGEELATRHAEAEAAVTALSTEVDELAAAVAGVKDSAAYRAGRDLVLRDRNVATLAQHARSQLAAAEDARQAEADAVAGADDLAREIAAESAEAAGTLAAARDGLAGAHLADALPTVPATDLRPAAALSEPVRTDLEGAPARLERPVPLVVAADADGLEQAAARVREVAAAAGARAGEAGNRLRGVEDVARARAEAAQAEHAAADADGRADADEVTARERTAERDRAAGELAEAWSAWTALPRTRELLGEVDWAAGPVGRLTDGGAPGEDPDETDAPSLRELDRAATEAAERARDELARTAAGLDTAEKDDAATRSRHGAERRGLLQARDPEPPGAPWAGALPEGTVPLWRAVDFAEGLTEDERAGLEAALLASGLLAAGVGPDGSLRAGDGQTLLVPAAPPAQAPLRAALVPDTAGPVPATAVTTVLARIGLGRDSHVTWVDVDGSWGNGPLRGKHTAPAARHVGTAAREAARAARLRELDGALAELDERAADRAGARERLRTARAELTEHVRGAPSTAPLARARTLAREAGRQAGRSRADATRLRERAVALHGASQEQERTHRDLCDRSGLPHDADGLRAVRETARSAQDLCARGAAALLTLAGRWRRHAETLQRLEAYRTKREAAERRAEDAWAEWHREQAEVAALQENLGQEADEVRRRLHAAEESHARARRELAAAREAAQRLGEEQAVARRDAETAADAAAAAQRQLAAAVDRLRRLVALPGLLAAATGDTEAEPPALAAADPVTPAGAEEAAAVVRDAVAGAGTADVNALMRARQKLEAALQGGVDVLHTVTEDVHLVELVDGAGRLPVARAAGQLRDRVARAREALTGREHEVFTNFVLGGVGEELRRRLAQSEQLVAAMNESLRSISTSHGIGVRLAWVLDAPEGSRVHRIRELVAAAPGEEDRTDELTTLLRELVEEQFALDETAGYAQHLKNALDYRAWHHMRVTILGPGPQDRRELRGRAKLSQGETRFVSYVTLFAAADAYLSGLGDRALRLVLLDDAFAKVDEPTIGELMGLLVRLDLDFCMTAHNLWVTYPQVPCADEYEILRSEGTPAVAVHTHWDGHARHLLTA
ncbi:TIGR02680 family protein [Georgenia sp. AZ-5]|uniref:TIGR02680 family protein n=1 Tax=Georgenia sp. AZ-5 TaxID=3367526 RepID=UPI0037554051